LFFLLYTSFEQPPATFPPSHRSSYFWSRLVNVEKFAYCCDRGWSSVAFSLIYARHDGEPRLSLPLRARNQVLVAHHSAFSLFNCFLVRWNHVASDASMHVEWVVLSRDDE
jgi:hypothetical protein